MSNSWADWQQNKRLEAAEEELAAERRARSRLADQIRQQQGDLKAQIERLTRAFVALVEHEDIRAELGQHADAAAVRRYAREVVSTVIVTGGAALRGVLEPADVPGYWLAAAARGVAETARGGAGGEPLLAEAERRDPVRTAVFLSLLDAVTRQSRWSAGRLDRVLPEKPEVNLAQRQIWLAVAEGRYDAAAAAPVVEGLSALVTAAGPQAGDTVGAWLGRETQVRVDATPAEAAEDRLAALRRVLVSGARGEPAPPVALSILGGDPDGEARAEPVAEDPLADCLRSLVDEGSPAEGDIVERMAVVRADMGFLDERTAAMAPAWSEPAGDVVTLLLDDLSQPVGSGRHTLARRVLGPTLQAVADDLQAEAARPVEEPRLVTAVGHEIAVTADGADSAQGDWRAAVAARVEQRNPQRPHLRPVGIGLLVAGVVLLGLTFVATGWLVLAVIALGAGAATLYAELRQHRELDRQQVDTAASTQRQVDRTAQQIKDEAARGVTAAVNAAEHRRAVKDELAGD